MAAHPVTTAGRPSKAETDPLDKGHVRIPGSPSFPVSVYNQGSSEGNTTGGSKHPKARAGLGHDRLTDVQLRLFLKLSGFDFMLH